MPSNRRGQNDPIGRALVQLLRHRLHENGLTALLRPDGYVPLEAVLRLQKFREVTVEAVQEVVRTNDKQRLALLEGPGDELFIRANQGHTITGISDEALLEPLDSTAAAALGNGKGHAVHGTYLSAWGAILASGGLKTMARRHIHLAAGLPGDSGVISGMRRSSEVFIWVDVVAAVRAGVPFYRSQNGVILTPGDAEGLLPMSLFASVVERATDREWRDGEWRSRSAVAAPQDATAGRAASESFSSGPEHLQAEEEETPLFMSAAPRTANQALDAIAALIDEEEEAKTGAPVSGRKRGMGELQVHMALTSCGAAAAATSSRQYDAPSNMDMEADGLETAAKRPREHASVSPP
jgi:2'-phosphotransferase